MKRSSLWAIVCLITGCAGGSHPAPAPAPSPAPRAAAPDTTPVAVAVVPPSASPATVPAADTTHTLDSLRLAVPDADSAADARVLEQLATAHPQAQDSGNDDGSPEAVPGGANSAATSEVTYDIDVSTYGSHRRVQYYLDFFQGPARERFSIWLQRMPRYEPMIRAKLRENGVPEDMVYLALIESGFSNAAMSRARAAGMWQFIKGTGKLYGLRIDSWVDERRDPVKATDAAARHLADLRDEFGSMYLAAAAYNAGAGKVGRGLRRLGDDDEDEDNPDAAFFRLYDTRFLRRETKDYVPKLIAAALIAKQPEKYGFERPAGIEAMRYDSMFVKDATGLDVLARLADTTLQALRDLNPQFVRLVTPPRQEVVVRLPAGTADLVSARYAALEPSARVNVVEHVVTRGQTVATIARSYRVSTRLIADANPGARLTRLRPGTRLLIPTSFVPTMPEPADAPHRARTPVTGSRATSIRYRVRSGESLWSIAQKYETTVFTLRSLNALSASDDLRAGQVIHVPASVVTIAPDSQPVAPAGGRTHVVRRGESLNSIASHYGVKLSALREANGMTNATVLKAGTRLRIPD